MTELETLVRAGLAELADEVRPTDLRARVATARRRTRNRNRWLAAGLAGAVTAGVAGVVVLPDGTDVPDVAEEPAVVQPWLPASIDLEATGSAAPDAELRMVFQTADGDGTVTSYGLLAGSDEIVLLPDLPATPELVEGAAGYDWPAQMSADGSLVLLQPRLADFVARQPAPRLVDARSGQPLDLPWRDDYVAAGISPDGRSLAVVTLAPLDVAASPPDTGPWGLVVVDLASGAERTVQLVGAPALDALSSQQYVARPPAWSTDGATVSFTVWTDTGTRASVTAAVAQGVAGTLVGSAAALAPWSPDGKALVVEGASVHSYRVVAADPTDPGAYGKVVDAGPVLGRNLLGWATQDLLLWFDPDQEALVQTDLSGDPVGRPVPVESDAEVVGVLLATPTVSP